MDEAPTILVLGGYGGAGLATARLLLKETDARLILAGRTFQKAERAAAELNTALPGGRASARVADAADGESLASTFKGATLVVVCSATVRHAEQIARAALEAGVDYLDIYYSQTTTPVLRGLAEEIGRAGRCFITQAGCHPGLPGVLVRTAEAHFTEFGSAIVGMAMNVPYFGTTQSVTELMEEIADYRTDLFRAGTWRKGTYRDVRTIDFGPPGSGGFGVRPCYPMFLEEMHSLPALYGLSEAGVYAAGFNWFSDMLVMPLAMVLGKMRKGLGAKTCARLLNWSVRFAKPPYGIVFKLEAAGRKDGKQRSVVITVGHENPYLLTAIPVVACIRQLLDGTIAGPGLHLMALAVQPEQLLKDMERMGALVSVSVN